MQKLAGKFLEVMKECRHIAKNGENDFHGYKYATSADVLGRVNAALVKYGIASVATPELLDMTDVTTAKGNIEHLATVKIEIKLLDQESGEELSISGLGSGQDSGDKAVMKAQTAAIKYAYMLSLAISTGDDPEADFCIDNQGTSIHSLPTEKKTSVSTQQKTSIEEKRKKTDVSICSKCGTQITEKVKLFSENRYGRPLCIDCQRQGKRIA